MSLSSDSEFEEAEWTPRPIVLPTFKIPDRLAAPLGWGLVAAAVLAVVAALVTAISYREPTAPSGGLLGPGVNLVVPSVGFATRISLFAEDAASLTVALLIVVAVIVAAMAVSADAESDSGGSKGWPQLLAATAVIGSIVVLANVAQAIVILMNATDQYKVVVSGDKLSGILALLPATLAAVAAAIYAAIRLRSLGNQTQPTSG